MNKTATIGQVVFVSKESGDRPFGGFKSVHITKEHIVTASIKDACAEEPGFEAKVCDELRGRRLAKPIPCRVVSDRAISP